MASTERSLGWATGVAGTDGVSAYDTTRMTAMERNTLGNGVLLTGSYLAISNTSSTLTIADGAALVGGYFYESNGAVTISNSGLGNTSYYILIIANTSGASLTVSANGAGTTTVTTATTRAAIVTAAQLSTIGSAIGGANYLLLGTINNNAGFNNLVPAYDQTAKVRGVPNSQFAVMSQSGSISVANNVATLLSYSSATNSADGSMRCDGTAGTINAPLGSYLVHFKVSWDTNATGTRVIAVAGDGVLVNSQIAQSATQTAYVNGIMEGTVIVANTSGPVTMYLQATQNSGANRTIGSYLFRAYRI